MCHNIKILVSTYKYYIRNCYRIYDKHLLKIVENEHKLHKSYGYHRMTNHIIIQVQKQLDKFMLNYNQQRTQVGLNGKTPSKFRLSA